jgi:uncharacterized protein (TIGR01777 family)
MNVLMTGGTGFIGKKLGQQLSKENHKIFVLTRNKKNLPFPCTQFNWEELESLVKSKSLEIQAIINLAGESIAQRWTHSTKNKILDSRVKTTSKLVEIFKNSHLEVFISASAIGYYGNRGDELLSEDSGAGSGFLTDVCHRWEAEAFKIQNETSARVVIFRFGMVLGNDGGALLKMVPAFKKGLGGIIGDGKTWVSWIHIDDLSEMMTRALHNNFKGIYNAVSPSPVRNEEFSEELAKALGKNLFLPIPKVALKILLGEMSQVLLSSQKVEPKHILGQRFKYKYPDIHDALAACV